MQRVQCVRIDDLSLRGGVFSGSYMRPEETVVAIELPHFYSTGEAWTL